MINKYIWNDRLNIISQKPREGGCYIVNSKKAVRVPVLCATVLSACRIAPTAGGSYTRTLDKVKRVKVGKGGRESEREGGKEERGKKKRREKGKEERKKESTGAERH